MHRLADFHSARSALIRIHCDQRSHTRFSRNEILRLSGSLRHKLLILSAFLLERSCSRSVLDITVGNVILTYSLGDLGFVHLGQLLGGLDIAHLLSKALGEDEVNFFKGSSGSLGVEEVNNGNKGSVERSEEEIGAPSNAGDEHRSDHDDEEVPQPVVDGGESVGLLAGLERVDFGRV